MEHRWQAAVADERGIWVVKIPKRIMKWAAESAGMWPVKRCANCHTWKTVHIPDPVVLYTK